MPIEVVNECETCKNSPNGMCRSHFSDWLTRAAKLTCLQHLLAALFCLFSFNFYGVYLELCWSLERLLEIGDYAPEGLFEAEGINWREPFYN